MQIKAAVTNSKSEDFKIETIQLDEPKAGEVLIRLVASGVCHTDMVAQDQEYPVPLPAVLGHEGSGVVEKVGVGVTTLEPGDHVVMGFAHCGKCNQCLSGHPFVCERFFELNFVGKMEDGSCRHHNHANEDLSIFFGQSSFGTYTVVNERNVVKVDKDVDLALLGPLGCGIQTGSGSVLNRLKPESGSSIVVFGAGAVGLSALMAAKAIGCGTIIAVDVHDNRLELAKELGATHTINGRNVNVPEEVKKIIAGGANYAVETAGVPGILRQAVDSLGIRGVVCQIGAPPLGTDEKIDVNDLLLANKTITGVVEGDSIPRIFIPQLISLYKEGKFPFDKLVKFYNFEDINQAVADSKNGSTIKPIIKMG
ncbi:NAD(P)-dependent alcohol dehydrogenase [Metabacillus sediminilitoris]|uniref:NAD(P)-dependent alcohol dehydrogenase n=1 Tax=Metabacillus sediminilitoris TaxID=2567941 RepID=A0A4S4BWZ1_9BACI|nr:NAD(P)-dependent alcohol dehydrogenase [Metabacillus sediminilitoris]QGQ45997.1 zinc-binding dehydrogenase [Metabacillus sediminilitoris]THF79681.1 NAD(P)-dependent alcohol dehydrogenase [Metabacillus sediminilitoris]